MAKDESYRRRGTDPTKISVPIYLQDPLVSKDTSGYVDYKDVELHSVAPLLPGPTSARVRVYDKDTTTGELYEPVTLLKNGRGFKLGKRHEDNLKLHQANVWGTVVRTLNLIEDAGVLGRSVRWAFDAERIEIWPHYAEGDNAYYERESKALYFEYFWNETKGCYVYGCLSHDLITHELGHAILDGLKPHYNEWTSFDTAGFHEYFGDAVSMFAALTHPEIKVHIGKDAPTSLTDTIVSKFADEFGTDEKANTNAIRSAENELTMTDVKKDPEAHYYAEVLSGLFYDVLQALYEAEIPRAQEARNTKKFNGQIAVHALFVAAAHTARLMLRGIDYCPPVDVSYLDYAQAVLRADEVAFPADDRGYRELLKKLIRKRKIATSMKQLAYRPTLSNYDLFEFDIDVVGSTKTDAYRFLHANRNALQIPGDAEFKVTNLYRTRKRSGRYHPPREIIVEFVWSERVRLPSDAAFGSMGGAFYTLWCGGTLVFDSLGNVLHYVVKLPTDARKSALKAYVAYLIEHEYLGASEASEDDGLIAARRQSDGSVEFKLNAKHRHARRP